MSDRLPPPDAEVLDVPVKRKHHDAVLHAKVEGLARVIRDTPAYQQECLGGTVNPG
jgi:hypothetical protein